MRGTSTPGTGGSLARRLGLGDATIIGLGSMIGAGVFAAFTPAAQAAGNGLLVGLVVAGFVAFANATSSAQLAARYPTSGGTYVYGREVLGPWWGYVAGWSFIIGKTASCAAMAMTFAAYASPPGWEKVVAASAVVALAAVNYVGVTRTAFLARIIVTIVLMTLAVVVAAGFAGVGLGAAGLGAADAGSAGAGDGSGTWMLTSVDPGMWVASGGYGILQSAGLLFFAFAGYARIATMGEEVREPERTIPRAIVLALGITIVVYALVAVSLLVSLGSDGVASTATPLFDVAVLAGWAWAEPVVRVGAAAASLGALLALIAGIGRTSLAMARGGDLPAWLAGVHPRFQVPHRAEMVLAAVVVVVVLVADVRGAIGFSSFGVLTYYFVANVAAWRQPEAERRFPRWLQVVGAVACVLLVVTLPWESVLVGIAVVAVGVAVRLLARR